MLKFFRGRKAKFMAAFFAVNFLAEIIFPTTAWALTGGPSQPETQGFAPIGTSDMVDVFSGDFSYNIPLMDVGGYPINIAYSSGRSMDEEASWTGLGWNVNVGSITRNMRGVPDDFDGDKVTRNFNMKPQEQFGVSLGSSLELFGVDLPKMLNVGFSLGLSYNNYNGVGFDMGLSPSVSSGAIAKTELTASLGLSASSGGGVGVSPSVSFESKMLDKKKRDVQLNGNIGLSVSSREGLKELSYGLSASYAQTKRVRGQKNEDGSAKTVDKGFNPNGGGSIDFSVPTYVPKQDMHLNNFSGTIAMKVSGEIFGVSPDLNLTGYYSRQVLFDKTKETQAFGYLYSQHGGERAMHDFNRENDGAFTEKTPNLPVTNYTYDIYSVAGQGVGGTYRAFRNDVGIVHDVESGVFSNADLSIQVGLEWGAGNGVKLGGNPSVSINTAKSGLWTKGNDTRKVLGFRNSIPNSLDEVVYFKQAGEMSAEQDFSVFEHLGAFDPIRTEIDNRFLGGYSLKQFVKNGQNTSIDPNLLYRKKRKNRNQMMRSITADEAQHDALIRNIESYDSFTLSNEGQYVPNTSKNRTRTQGFYQKHHTSEISIVRSDGVRYVYGIPAYNTVQKEQTFAVSQQGNTATGLVDYSSTEASTGNESGSDHYFDQTITPAYAHSYLLTAVVSPDYVDVTGDGPTDDDLGTYTRFNYDRKVENYKWRTPYNKANYNEGLKSQTVDNPKTSDDQANYTYGEKEVWYIHSIVTKNYVAEFVLSDRQDGLGVAGEQGGNTSNGAAKLQKLDEIRLYSKAEKIKLGNAATPIKAVHFEYDYSLCTGIDNNSKSQLLSPNETANQGGKLTLKKLWFTYEGSNKAILNSYKFNYSSFNPKYDIKGYDRWGNYKPNEATGSLSPNAPLSTSEFPYTSQDKVVQDRQAGAWELTEIKLPSGGKIKVDYESDDYAYVQDKRAMEMFLIEGAGSSVSPTQLNNNQLFTGNVLNHFENQYLYFKLQEPIDGNLNNANAYVKNRYLKDIEQLYFRFLMDLKGDGSSHEFVSGYVELDETADYAGVVQTASTIVNSKYTYGYVKIKRVKLEGTSFTETDCHPISKAGWQFTRIHLPRVAYGQPDPDNNGFVQMLEAMGSTLQQIVQFIEGFNRDLMNRGFSKKFVSNKSWIRLQQPTYNKLGGGSRVKKIAMSDEWGDLVNGQQSFEYGQVYDYTKKEMVDGQEITISSGVAVWEPGLGADENSHKLPIFVDETKLLAPDTRSYTEEPIGESFFPSASVGYSVVTVKDLPREGVKRNATGKVVHRFVTAREFPTITRRTEVKPLHQKPNKILKFLNLRNADFMTASQGFVVELNDMHGKQLGQEVYPEGSDQPISFTRYIYKTKAPLMQGVRNELVNNADVAFRYVDGGSIIKADQQIGVDYDIISDMRESNTYSFSPGLNGNLDAFLAAIFPVAIPSVFPTLNEERTKFSSSVITKVINRYALVDEVIANDLGSTVATKNLLYDGETGEVLLTQTINQYEDPIYSFTYPAHWSYDRMGMAFRNEGFRVNEDVSLSGMSSDLAKNFVLGDELLLYKQDGSDAKIVWVTAVNSSGISVVARDNSTPSGNWSMVITRSGRRNLQSTPVGSVVTLKNPLKDMGNGLKKLSFDQVLNAGATEFTDKWKSNCNCGVNPAENNKFLLGAAGSWRPKKSWVYLTDRVQSRQNNNTNTRRDGVFKKYSPFWLPSTTSQSEWSASNTGWQFTTEVSFFNMHGLELENRDALNRYSAALYGYYFSLPTAVANNSRISDVAFDSFEDYLAKDCDDDHFSFRKNKTWRSDSESHSGKYSLHVPAGSEATLRKVISPCTNGN